MQYDLIDSEHLFEQRLGELQQGLFALDSEFIRVGTYRAHLGLLQLYDGCQLFLIDPMAVTDWTALKCLLCARSSQMVLHAGSEDLILLRDCLGQAPEDVLDTQIAAAFLGYGLSVGLAALCEQFLGVALPKSYTRTNWLQRPLAAQQLQYAAQDVYYLLPVFEKLQEKLHQQGWWRWFVEESHRVASARLQPECAQDAYLKIGDAWRLYPRQLAVLQRLAAWREQVASDLDVPLARVVSNAGLVQLAQKWPKRPTDLIQVQMDPDLVRSNAKHILALVEAAAQLSGSECPKPIVNTVGGSYKKKYRELKQRITPISRTIGIPENVLAPKKLLHDYLKWRDIDPSLPQPVLITGWREEIFGDAFR